MTFDSEHTGLAERIVVECPDAQILLAVFKFTQGFQRVLDMYGDGAIDLSYATYLSYLEGPITLWDDHPDLRGIVTARSGQGVQALELFEQAIQHYRVVETTLWNRLSGPSEDFLFEVVTADVLGRLEFSDRLNQLVESFL